MAMELTKHDLFYNLDEDDQYQLLYCFKTYTRDYYNHETIDLFCDGSKRVGIIERGSACVVTDLPSGARAVLEYLKEGDIFGELFYYYSNKQDIYVEAADKCRIRYIDYEHIIKRCARACPRHSQLVNNVLIMMSRKAQDICEHMNILSQRTIRERLMRFFELKANQAGSTTFTLPFNMGTLAEYISVDRCSMSRELRKMKDEKIIKMDRKKITLLYNPEIVPEDDSIKFISQI